MILLLSDRQMSNYKGADLAIDAFPKAKVLPGDRGYGAHWFRHALIERDITKCILSKSNHEMPIPNDRTLYRQWHRVENMFSVHTRYDRCAHFFMSAIYIAATAIFWINR